MLVSGIALSDTDVSVDLSKGKFVALSRYPAPGHLTNYRKLPNLDKFTTQELMDRIYRTIPFGKVSTMEVSNYCVEMFDHIGLDVYCLFAFQTDDGRVIIQHST